MIERRRPQRGRGFPVSSCLRTISCAGAPGKEDRPGHAAAPSEAARPVDAFLRKTFPLAPTAQFSDFYATSECRDLIFHVEEHCLTLETISAFLAESGVRFIGFDIDAPALQAYRARFPDDRAATDLGQWSRFEADHPLTFVGMYQFWIQKPG